MKMLSFTLILLALSVTGYAGSELWDCKTTCKQEKNKDAMECEHCFAPKL